MAVNKIQQPREPWQSRGMVLVRIWRTLQQHLYYTSPQTQILYTNRNRWTNSPQWIPLNWNWKQLRGSIDAYSSPDTLILIHERKQMHTHNETNGCWCCFFVFVSVSVFFFFYFRWPFSSPIWLGQKITIQ